MNSAEDLFDLYESDLGIYEEVEEGFVPLDDRKRALVTGFINKGVDKLRGNVAKIEVAKQELANKQIPSHSIGKLVKDTTKTSKLVNNAQKARDRSTQERIAIIRKQLDLVTPKNNVKTFQRNDVEYVLDYLIDEGYTDSYDSATYILGAMSDDWLNEILEAFNPSDYQEYHRKNHLDSSDDRKQEEEDRYLDYLRSREDIRDKHNAARGVKKKRGSKK